MGTVDLEVKVLIQVNEVGLRRIFCLFIQVKGKLVGPPELIFGIIIGADGVFNRVGTGHEQYAGSYDPGSHDAGMAGFNGNKQPAEMIILVHPVNFFGHIIRGQEREK